MRMQLPRHSQLRAKRRSKIPILLAMGLPRPLPRSRTNSNTRMRIRPRRNKRLHSLCSKTLLRRNPLPRHRRLQRRRPPQSICNQLQPRNKHPRNHPTRQILAQRRMGRNRSTFATPTNHLSRNWTTRVIPHVSRRTRITCQKLPNAQTSTLLDDLRTRIPHTPSRNTKHRNVTHRRNRLQRTKNRTNTIPQSRAPSTRISRLRLHRLHLNRMPHSWNQRRRRTHILYLQ